jgi:hypothetical protein
MRAYVRCCCIAFLLSWSPLIPSSHFLFGQSVATASEIPRPVTSGIASHVDSSALTEINQHLMAVGNAPWTGMQATGQIVYGSDQTSSGKPDHSG